MVEQNLIIGPVTLGIGSEQQHLGVDVGDGRGGDVMQPVATLDEDDRGLEASLQTRQHPFEARRPRIVPAVHVDAAQLGQVFAGLATMRGRDGHGALEILRP